MAESFIFSIAEQVLGKLGPLALQEFGLAWGVKSELEKLERTVTTIKAVLLDAEEKQETNRQLSVWLENLKDVFYEAIEVLDEFEYEALQQQVVNRGSPIEKVCHFFSDSNPLVFPFIMGHKIKNIRERLNEIANEKSQFHLTEQNVDGRAVPVHGQRETYSTLDTSDVIGRDHDKEMILPLLLQSNDHESLFVIPIVGIGGLGKTTLAKMVYNDDRVIEHFELRMWVHVSEHFDLRKLIENIVKVAVGMDCKNLNMEQLQAFLHQTLRARRYLLILDDVWNEDPSKWMELRGLLVVGAGGSKIVVTTRNHSVASIMGTTPAYNVQGLSPEESLSLLMKWAFLNGQGDQHLNLVEIGKDIVNKCKGIPLAIRTLGSLLCMKTDERDWWFVRDSEIWDLEQREGSILPVLKLSYNQLPSYLKQCFAFCSIFPKGYEIHSIDLICMWMAQGLIQSSGQILEWEDIGERYFTELCSRSFFHDVEDWFFFRQFKIHDLMHDLALLVTRKECSILNEDTQNISKKVRHVSFYEEDLVKDGVPNSILQLKNLQTILLPYTEVGSACSKSFAETCISSFKCLRVLDLRESRVEMLPSSIGKLKQLRYLNLSDNDVIESLPNSICKLYRLQTLFIGGCTKLQKLPKDLGNLINLRCLFLTTQEKCLSMNGMGSLTSLRILVIQSCGNLEYMFDDDVVGIRMQCLTALRSLVINGCENLISLPQSLRYLTALENLIICDCKNLDLSINDLVGDEYINELGGGVRNLRSLVFEELPKLLNLPRWLLLRDTAVHTLKHISIKHCSNFTTLPEWLSEDLKSTQKLWIAECPELTSLPEGMNQLIALKEIHITNCPQLIERCQRETGADWHKIAHVPNIYLNMVKVQNQ